MPTFVEMDARSTLAAQMEQDVGPVILINTFTVNADETPCCRSSENVDF
jgi:hypothetical protein